MINTQTLRLTKTKELIFTVIFIGLSVYTPMVVHYFGGVGLGRSFLPMHFFVLMAGLLLGWRAILAVAAFLFWYFFDFYREYLWFVILAIIGAGIYLTYLYLLRKKIREQNEKIETGKK